MKTYLVYRIFLLSVLLLPDSVFSHKGYIISFQEICLNPSFIANPDHSDYALNLNFRKGFFPIFRCIDTPKPDG